MGFFLLSERVLQTLEKETWREREGKGRLGRSISVGWINMLVGVGVVCIDQRAGLQQRRYAFAFVRYNTLLR